MHVKVKIEEGKGTTLVSALEDYRVLGMYTKTYNKWFVSENKKHNWKRGMDEGKVRVFMRMIKFDHLMGKFKDLKPAESAKWGKKSIFVMCDACDIIDVVQKLSVV